MKARKSEEWQRILQKRSMARDDISERYDLSLQVLDRIQNHFPIRFGSNGGEVPQGEDPIARQFVPDERELNPAGLKDPLDEEAHRQGELIIHRYPNRALFLVSNICASYCRFCTRRRLVGQAPFPRKQQIQSALEYIEHHKGINEVILSGGDPLMLVDDKIESILVALTRLSNVRVIRIATRIFLPLPERITPGLIDLLERFQPLYVITQFNHPDEFLPEVDLAIERVIRRGIPLLNQSVLLAGINDSGEVMLELVQKMIERRIRPYYLHQLDPVQGVMHFEVPVKKGRQIIEFMRKKIGGYAVPIYVFDDPSKPAKTMLYPTGRKAE